MHLAHNSVEIMSLCCISINDSIFTHISYPEILLQYLCSKLH